MSYDLRDLSGQQPSTPELGEALGRAAAALSLSRSWREDLRAGLARTLEGLADTGAATLQATFEQWEVAGAVTAGRQPQAPPGWWAR